MQSNIALLRTGRQHLAMSIARAVGPPQSSTLDRITPAMDPKLPIRSLDYTVIFARHMPAMRKFYGSVLGFPLHRELSPRWIEYRIGSTILALTERGAMFDDPSPPVGALSLQLAFRVAPGEVATCAETLKGRGVAIISGPTDRPFGHRTLFFRDPDGNVLEIYAEI